MSQRLLARRAGMTGGYLKSLEDNVPVSPDVLERLAGALDTTVEYLKSGEDPTHRRSLQNFERYVEDRELPENEAGELRKLVTEQLVLIRGNCPMDTMDFDRLRSVNQNRPIIESRCPRCQAPQWSDGAGFCERCGGPGDAPDN